MTDGDAHGRAQLSDADAEAALARREALQAAVSDLEEHLGDLEAQDVPDPDRFRRAVEQLLATLLRHVEEADAPDGLLAQVLEEASWFASRVEALRGEHVDLLGRTTSLLERARAADDVRPLLTDARQLSGHVAEHRRRGTTLLVDATMLDLSAGD
jgi:hypothetical protein